MQISATIRNKYQLNQVTVITENQEKEMHIPGKTEGYGSSVNGGVLLFLALATCFCNDLYREAGRRKMSIQAVEVTVTGEFGKEGEPAANIRYRVNVQAPAHTEQEIQELVDFVDGVAEVHNTIRKGCSVSLDH